MPLLACYRLNTVNQIFNENVENNTKLSELGGTYDPDLNGVWFKHHPDNESIEELFGIKSSYLDSIRDHGEVIAEGVFYKNEFIPIPEEYRDQIKPDYAFVVYTYEENIVIPIWVIWEDEPDTMYQVTGECFEDHEEVGCSISKYAIQTLDKI